MTEIAGRFVNRKDISWDESQREQLRLSLHHDHLPQLEEVGFVEYDRESRTIETASRDRLKAGIDDVSRLEELVSQFTSTSQPSDGSIEMLEGRESIYEYGRELADDADDELFLIYTTAELLEGDCLPHAEEAIDRGVEFYAGAKSRDVRDFFSERLERATIWEPQLDWMHREPGYPTISRLIFADRSQVVVGLWNESADGTKREVAVVGEGETNPLVVLVRELLGPRLDHLDYQSEAFLDDLPFES